MAFRKQNLVINNEENSSDKSKTKVGDYLWGGGRNPRSTSWSVTRAASPARSQRQESEEKEKEAAPA